MILGGFVKFSVGSFLSLVVSFFTTPIITALISPEYFGIATLFSSISFFLFPLATLGTSSAFTRFFYEVKPEDRSSLLWNSLIPPVVFFIALVFFLFNFKNRIAILLFSIDNGKLVVLLVVDIFVKIINRFALLIVRMQKKGGMYSFLTVVASIVNAGFIIIYSFKVEKSFFAIILGGFVSTLFVTILAIILEKKIWFSRCTIISLTEIKKSLAYGLPLLFAAFFQMIFQTMDKYFIRFLAGFQQLGLYSAAFKIVSLLSIIQTAFSLYFTPVAFENYERDNKDKGLYENIYAVVMPVLILFGLGLILVKDVITLIFDKSYKDSASIFPFLVFLPVLYILTEITSLGVYFKKKVHYEIYVYIILAFLSIGLNWILIRLFYAKGAAMALSLNYILYFFLRSLVSMKLYPININWGKTIVYLAVLWVSALVNTFVVEKFIGYLLVVSFIIIICFFEKNLLLNQCKIIYFEFKKRFKTHGRF
jgi:O-antigen/teichoic acid export membrane protein